MREPWEKPEKKPELLGDILKKWQKQFKLEVGWKQYQIISAWEQVADDATKQHAKPLGFRKHVLKVTIDSPVHYFEMVNFKKKSLLKKLQQNSKVYVEDINFVCLGKTNE